jgi:hypothetical protein
VIGNQPYELVHGLEEIASTGTVTDKYYALAKDIDAAEWSAANAGQVTSVIGGFDNSTLTGLGHTVNNLSIKDKRKKNAGFLGATTNVILRDVGIKDAQIHGSTGYAGALVGLLRNGKVFNAYAEGGAITLATGATSPAGGLIGAITVSDTRVSHAYASVDVTGTGTGSSSFAGGLIGFVNTSVRLDLEQAHATGNVSLDGSGAGAGGLVGGIVAGRTAPTNITASYATGAVSGRQQIGGLIGVANGGTTLENVTAITDSFATGDISTTAPDTTTTGNYFGGLIGLALDAKVSNSYATGTLTMNVEGAMQRIGNVGGLIGSVGGASSVTYTHASGDISILSPSIDGIGGLAGALAKGSSIAYSYATGNVEGVEFERKVDGDVLVPGFAGSSMGGLVGGGYGDISNSHASGNVAGNQNVGGLVGSTMGGNITDSSASGDVTGIFYTGGIVGNASGTRINGAIATGDVEGFSHVGGIAGSLFAYGGSGGGNPIIENSIADNKVTGTENVGGVVGKMEDSLTIDNSYYNQDKNPDLGLTPRNEQDGEIIGSGGLSTEQLADSGIQDAIVSGGDVAGAVADYDAAQAALPAEDAPAVDEPIAETPSTVDEPIAETTQPAVDEPIAETTQPSVDEPIAETTQPAVNEPIAETTPVSNPPVAQTPVDSANTTPPIVDAPVAQIPIANDPIAEHPVTENAVVEVPTVDSLIVENPHTDAPPIANVDPANVVDANAAQTIAAQIANSGAQRAVDVLPDIIRKQTGNLEQTHIPLEQLMAHLSNASAVAPAQPTSAPASETPKPGFDSNVNNIVGDGECLATDGSCGGKK